MKNHSPRLLLALLVLSLGSLGATDSCGSDILADPSFDLWCQDEAGQQTLCTWELEEGRIEPVPTWHEAEEGASLIGELVSISQLVELGSDELDCIFFTLNAEVSDEDDADSGERASLALLLDFNDDGLVELDQVLVADDYRAVQLFLTPPEEFESVRVRVRKTGAGEAILAAIRAQSESSDNCHEAPIELLQP